MKGSLIARIRELEQEKNLPPVPKEVLLKMENSLLVREVERLEHLPKSEVRIPGVVREVPVTLIHRREVPAACVLPQIRRGARVSIVISTPDIMGENFPRCLSHLKTFTSMEYQVVVVETHFIEDLYNHARDMNILLRGVDFSGYLVLMNDDLFVDQGWLEELVKPTLKDPKVGIVGGLWLYPDKKTIQHGGVYCDPHADYTFGHRFHFKRVDEAPAALQESTVVGVTGACFLITQPCRDSVGLWDQKNFPLGWNDPDYCIRAWLRGWKVVYNPGCTAVHAEGVTLKGHGTQRRAHETCFPNFRRKWSNQIFDRILSLADDQLVTPYLREVHGW